MKLVIEPAAAKQLAGMPRRDALSMITLLHRIAEAPFDTHPQAKPLRGSPSSYRARRGDWRAIYRLDAETGEMVVEAVGSRREIYR